MCKKEWYALHSSSPSSPRAKYLFKMVLLGVFCVFPVTKASKWMLHLPFLMSEWGWKLVPNYGVKLLIGRHTNLSQLHFPCLLVSCVKMSNPPFYMIKIEKILLKMEYQVKTFPRMCPFHIFFNVRIHSKKNPTYSLFN